MNTVTQHSVIDAAREYVDRHYTEGIQLQHVARALNYTPSHLTYLVRIATGKPLNAWIIERRIEEAQRRLMSTSDTVEKICEAVGFRDVSYFARQFARTTGLTPTRWRSSLRNAESAAERCHACGALRFFDAA